MSLPTFGYVNLGSGTIILCHDSDDWLYYWPSKPFNCWRRLKSYLFIHVAFALLQLLGSPGPKKRETFPHIKNPRPEPKGRSTIQVVVVFSLCLYERIQLGSRKVMCKRKRSKWTFSIRSWPHNCPCHEKFYDPYMSFSMSTSTSWQCVRPPVEWHDTTVKAIMLDVMLLVDFEFLSLI